MARNPVIASATAPPSRLRQSLRLGVALAVSFATHAVLLVLFFLVGPAAPVQSQPELIQNTTITDEMLADAQEALPREMFDIIESMPTDVSNGGELTNDRQRKAEVTVPGRDDPREAIGARDGSDVPPASYPPPRGLGDGAGAPDAGGVPVLIPGDGAAGGGTVGHHAFDLRKGGSGATIERIRALGSTAPAEAAVARGLKWFVRQQSPDGRWLLDGSFRDRGAANDTAGTALGLLPFLGAGKTHRPSRDNVYDKVVSRALRVLISRQDPRRGDLGGGMYAHAIATIALSEAYGLTQDPALRLPAQRAVNFIVFAQHPAGGWRYSPGQEGDLSVTGWQVMALKSAQMAGLDVPAVTLRRADRFLDGLVSPTEGYGYTDRGATPTMSAVGLLCRQFLHGWGPQNPRLIQGINTNLKPVPPGAKKDAYYHYYATQVMYHFGGDAWKAWNGKMRELLIQAQEANPASSDFGSWTSAGDAWGTSGGRLMVTSLNLMTLEVYYRYLPLYYRDAGARKDRSGL